MTQQTLLKSFTPVQKTLVCPRCATVVAVRILDPVPNNTRITSPCPANYCEGGLIEAAPTQSIERKPSYWLDFRLPIIEEYYETPLFKNRLLVRETKDVWVVEIQGAPA